MSTAREQILDFMRKAGRARPVDMADAVEASQDAIYEALRVMVERGELEREDVGIYRITEGGKAAVSAAAETEPVGIAPAAPAGPAAEKQQRKKARFTPAQKPHSAQNQPAEADGTTDTPDPLQWALWHDGDLMLRRGEDTLVLSCAEVTRLHAWLAAKRGNLRRGMRRDRIDVARQGCSQMTADELREHADMPAQAQALRLPEPLTDEEVDALIDETEYLTTDRAVRYLVETGEHRVKEANK